MTLRVFPPMPTNWSFTWPLTDISLAIFGSWTKDCPRLLPGGTSPVVTYLRHSKEVTFYMNVKAFNCKVPINVVLPHPFCPRIRVKGEKNSIFWRSSASGPNDRIPWTWTNHWSDSRTEWKSNLHFLYLRHLQSRAYVNKMTILLEE